MKLRPSRARRRGRIEIIPMIDVMFFLLATFMFAALAMQNLHSLPVNLPKGDAQPMLITHPLTLTVTQDGRLLVNEESVTLDELPGAIALRMSADKTVIVNADTDARNGGVVQAMLAARSAGAEKFLFAIRKK